MRILTLLLALPLLAQVPSATITGTVLDPQGYPVPGAKVTAKSLDTRFEIARESDPDGTFRLSGLPPGNYALEVAHRLFQPYEIRPIKLEVRQVVELAIRVPFAGVYENIKVVGTATPVEAAAEPMGFNVDQDQISRLPLIERNVAGLAMLGPGVVPRHLSGFISDTYTSLEPNRGDVAVNPPVNGVRSTANTFLLDGVLNTDGNINAVVVNPPIESVQEVRIQTSAGSAEFGYRGGAVVNVVTPSGTQHFHGGLFDYFRNEALDAQSFFNSGFPKAPFRQNQFGGQAGGRIPHSQRLFFFGAYEGLRLNEGQNNGGPISVPTTALRGGDFNGQGPITDPLTGLPFPSDKIPTARIDPIAAAVLASYEPLPNLPGLTSNYVENPPILRSNDSATARVDWNTARYGNFFARYSMNSERADSGNIMLVLPTRERLLAQQAAIGHTFAGKNRGDWVNEVRVGFNRLRLLETTENAYTNNIIGKLGIGGIDQDPANWGLPTFILSDFFITSDLNTLPLTQRDDTFQALDNFSVRRGRHTIQLGADVRRFLMGYESRQNSRGTFGFGGQYTGDALGDFLLGAPTNTQRTAGQPQAYLRQLGYAFYAQDEFRVARRLILTYGLRYDYTSPFSDERNNLYNLDYSTLPSAPRLVREGSGTLAYANRANFAPRLGLAWRPMESRNLIFRAAYGIFYSPEPATEFYDLISNGVITETETAPAGSPPILSLKNGFPSSATTGFPTYFGLDPHAKTPYIQQWNGVWQYAAGAFLFEVGYVGTKGTDLGLFRKFNTPAHVETGQNLAPRDGDIQSLRTFPQLGPLIQRQHIANSIYHALQLRVDRRWSNGLAMQASFVWSKSIDDAANPIPGLFENVGAQDERNLRLERGLSFFNVGRRFTMNFAYDLPFGRGHRFVSGWTLSGTGVAQDGTPLNAFYFFTDPANSDTFNRPNVVPGQSLLLPADQRTPQSYYNPAAFSMPAPLTFGNAGRDILPQPATVSFDFAVSRRFTLNERLSLDVRGEFYNAFNHPNLGIPVNNPDFVGFYGQFLAVGDPRHVQLALKLRF